MQIDISSKQMKFIKSQANEVLFGGAAGGGKSYGQLVDALLYAVKYPKSKQLVLRRSFPDLERSLILTSLELFPKQLAKYNQTKHKWDFYNGSLIEFGYCDNEKDVYRYQGAEYDTIRFDELTHFTEQMYLYLISRLRGANSYPKQIKSTTNPGGIGHYWVKKRFIDIGSANEIIATSSGSRVFIQSFVNDNKFLLEKDPLYVKRLENLSQDDKKALLYGNWDIFEGQFFTEFNRDSHTVMPFTIPKDWRRYITIDYGLDMLAALWIAVDNFNNAYIYKEVYESNLIISQAAQKIINVSGDDEIYAVLAPPDLWNRRQETGKSAADIFRENNLKLTKTNNDRVTGWLAVKEWLSPKMDEHGKLNPKLKIFNNCLNIIRTLPALQFDKTNPNDVSGTPHELTHAPDALRGFCVYKTKGNPITEEKAKTIDEIFGFNDNKNKFKGEKINVI